MAIENPDSVTDPKERYTNPELCVARSDNTNVSDLACSATNDYYYSISLEHEDAFTQDVVLDPKDLRGWSFTSKFCIDNAEDTTYCTGS